MVNQLLFVTGISTNDRDRLVISVACSTVTVSVTSLALSVSVKTALDDWSPLGNDVIHPTGSKAQAL